MQNFLIISLGLVVFPFLAGWIYSSYKRKINKKRRELRNKIIINGKLR